MRTEPRRLWFLTLLAAALGVAGGAAAWVLVHLIGLITNLALFHRWGWELPSFADYRPDGWLFVAAAGGALVVAAMALWAPMIRGHGIPEAMDSVLTRQSRVSPRMAIAKPLSAAIAIGTGGRSAPRGRSSSPGVRSVRPWVS